MFVDVRGEGVKVQVMANAKYFPSQEKFEQIMGRMRRGDIVGFVGHPAKTKKVNVLLLHAIKFFSWFYYNCV